LTDTAAKGDGDLVTNWELVEEAVNANSVAAGNFTFLEGYFQCVETEGSVVGAHGSGTAEGGTAEVASTQGGAQQVLTSEAGVEDQTNVVVEGGATFKLSSQVGNLCTAQTAEGVSRVGKLDCSTIGTASSSIISI